MMKDYTSLLQALGCDIEIPLLRQALTHRSFAYEHEGMPHNERLEHLGDAVLQLVISEMLYNEYAESPESALTKMRANIVNTHALAATARSLGLGKYLLLGHGEKNQGGNDKDSILADSLEAVIGAIYCEHGYQPSFHILSTIFAEAVKCADMKQHRSDWKTPLQELLAKLKLPVARYEVERSGPEHQSTFTAKVYIQDKFYGHGIGSNRRSAEQQAAKVACQTLGTQTAATDMQT